MAGSAQNWSSLFPVLFLDEFGAQIADRLHDAVERGAHFGLELAVFGTALVEQALGDGEARLMPGQRDAKLGALQIEVAAQAQIAGDECRRRPW